MNILNLPTAEQYDLTNKYLASIALSVSEGNSPWIVQSWADVQQAVRLGIASKIFGVGDQLMADYNGVSVVWDIIGIDHETPTNPALTHSLTIQANRLIASGRISGPEALFNAVAGLAAGAHIFTTNGLQYTFTSAQAVPAGGVIYIKTRSDYVPLTLTIYAADRRTVLEDNIVVSPTAGVDDLSPINDHVRMRYGNNDWKISALRQWLNSDASSWVWSPMGLYDMPSTYASSGFLALLDPELLEVIGVADKQVAKATYDGGGQDLFSDKVFLPSRVEMGLGTEGVTTGEAVYPFWDGSTNADRIKLNLSGTPGYWWLRSPNVSLSYSTRNVYPSGELSSNGAHNTIGLAPACAII